MNTQEAVMVQIRVAPEVRKALKLLAIEKNVSVSELLEEMIETFKNQ